MIDKIFVFILAVLLVWVFIYSAFYAPVKNFAITYEKRGKSRSIKVTKRSGIVRIVLFLITDKSDCWAEADAFIADVLKRNADKVVITKDVHDSRLSEASLFGDDISLADAIAFRKRIRVLARKNEQWRNKVQADRLVEFLND